MYMIIQKHTGVGIIKNKNNMLVRVGGEERERGRLVVQSPKEMSVLVGVLAEDCH